MIRFDHLGRICLADLELVVRQHLKVALLANNSRCEDVNLLADGHRFPVVRPLRESKATPEPVQCALEEAVRLYNVCYGLGLIAVVRSQAERTALKMR